jgi:hypothetical protein
MWTVYPRVNIGMSASAPLLGLSGHDQLMSTGPISGARTVLSFTSRGRYLDGAGGACRVRSWARIFQSEPSFTSTRIQLPVTVSPGFIFGFLL